MSNDWICGACGGNNFKNRNNCWTCKKPKLSFSSNSNNESNNSIKKYGDWDCACGELNFASRIKCRNCDIEKPHDHNNIQLNTYQPKISIKFGDWLCPNTACNEHNFKSRDICRKCNTPKGEILTNNLNKQTENEPVSKCVICLENPKTHAIVKCGHFCYCGVCGFAITKCPICRVIYNPDTDLLKLFDV